MPVVAESVSSPSGARSARRLVVWAGVERGVWITVGMWAVWWVTHLPSLRPPVEVGMTLLVGLILLGAAWAGRSVSGGWRSGWMVGLIAALVAALMSVLVLGSKVSEQAAELAALRPNALAANAGAATGAYLLAAAVAGAVGGAAGGVLPRASGRAGVSKAGGAHVAHGAVEGRLASLAWAVAAATVMLLVAGGTVTSANAGMAVPDAVTTYGAVSFLFPLSLMSDPRVYFEHTHRLFGTLVGVLALVLMAGAMLRYRRGWVVALVLALALVLVPAVPVVVGTVSSGAEAAPLEGVNWGVVIGLSSVGWLTAVAVACWSLATRRLVLLVAMIAALVGLQGLFGIVRVDRNASIWAMLHGLSAQVVFLLMVVAAVRLSPLLGAAGGGVSEQTRAAAARGARWAAALLGCLAFQLVMGAVYRHLGTAHALWTHVVFALVVAGVAVLTGAVLTRADGVSAEGVRLRRIGVALVWVVGAQFCLGFLALWAVGLSGGGGSIPLASELDVTPMVSAGEAIMPTAHQTLGAVLLALAGAAACWSRGLRRAEPAA